jgi:transposase
MIYNLYIRLKRAEVFPTLTSIQPGRLKKGVTVMTTRLEKTEAKLLNFYEVAQRLNCTHGTIYRWYNAFKDERNEFGEKLFPVVERGDKKYVREDKLELISRLPRRPPGRPKGWSPNRDRNELTEAVS